MGCISCFTFLLYAVCQLACFTFPIVKFNFKHGIPNWSTQSQCLTFVASYFIIAVLLFNWPAALKWFSLTSQCLPRLSIPFFLVLEESVLLFSPPHIGTYLFKLHPCSDKAHILIHYGPANMDQSVSCIGQSLHETFYESQIKMKANGWISSENRNIINKILSASTHHHSGSL